MAENIQTKIDRTIGLPSCDLTSLTELEDIVPHIASSCPSCTVADLSENVGSAISRVEGALAGLRAFKTALDAKPANELVFVAYMDEVERSFLFNEKECGSYLGWLLGHAIQEYKAGNRAAVDRFVEASEHLNEVYSSAAGNNIDNPHNTMSDTFDAFTKRAEEFVKGRISSFSTYAEFIKRLHCVPAKQE